MSFTYGGISGFDANLTGSATIAASAATASAAINNSGKALTVVDLTLTYNAAATKGAKIEVLRSYDGGTTFQTGSSGGANVSTDAPFSFLAPFTANTTVHLSFTVPGTIDNFKINVANTDTGQSMTNVGMKINQATN